MGTVWVGEVESTGAVRAMDARSVSGDFNAFLRNSMPCLISSAVSALPRRSAAGRSISRFALGEPANATNPNGSSRDRS